MVTTFLNSEIKKLLIHKGYYLLLTNKIDLWKTETSAADQILAYSIKRFCKHNKFQISAPTWNDKFELSVRLYSVSDVQDCFQYVMKKHKTLTDNALIRNNM